MTKRDFMAIKLGYEQWKKSDKTEIEQCYKTGGSEAKKNAYFDIKYYMRHEYGAHDFRICNAAVQTFTCGCIYDQGIQENIFRYFLPTRCLSLPIEFIERNYDEIKHEIKDW